MNLVDSCGWLEYLADGPNAGFFAPAVEKTDKLSIWTQDADMQHVDGVKFVRKK